MIRRIEVQNDILYFKLRDKGITFPKFEVDKRKTKLFIMPSESEIAETMTNAKMVAIEEAREFGMSVEENILENYQIPYNSNICEEEDFEESECLENKQNVGDEIAETEDCIELKNSTCEKTSIDHRYTHILFENGVKKKILKSTLVWLYSDGNKKISNDRLKRVQVSTEEKQDDVSDVNTAVSAPKLRRKSVH